MKTKTKAALTWWAIALFVLAFWGTFSVVIYHFLSRWW